MESRLGGLLKPSGCLLTYSPRGPRRGTGWAICPPTPRPTRRRHQNPAQTRPAPTRTHPRIARAARTRSRTPLTRTSAFQPLVARCRLRLSAHEPRSTSGEGNSPELLSPGVVASVLFENYSVIARIPWHIET